VKSIESETGSAAGVGEAEPGPVVVLTGPTAAGKSSLALEMAARFDADILNADSMQVYRYMDIGTAKPSLEERAQAPHHLFDIVNPDAEYSAGRYAADAHEVASRSFEAGRVVLLVGGTGLYIRAFLEGLIDTGGANRELREELEAEHAKALAEGEPERLHARLAKMDPKAADKIHPRDLRRTIRAIEIVERCGRAASSVREDHGFRENRYRTLHLALDPGRDVVNERIDARCKQMIDSGLLQEVRRLRTMGYGPELRSMQAIGYRHINPVVDGSDTLANALEAMRRDTKRFARRQRTWLRKIEDAVWIDPRDRDAVLRRVEDFLGQTSGEV
jgi:tRNA dimethylallyltransferase